jgi:WD40 repeat protein
LPERCHAFAVDPQESALVVVAVSGNAYTWPLPARPEDVVVAPAPAAPVQVPVPAAPAARPSAAPNGLKQIVTGRLQGIQAVKILPDGKSFVAGGSTIERWDVNGSRLRQFHTGRAFTTRFFLSHSADGKRLAWGNEFDPQVVLDVSTGREIGKFTGKRSQLTALCLSPDGSRVFSGFHDGGAVVWNAATGGIVQELSKQRPSIYGAEFVPDGKHAILAHISGKVQLVDTTSWKAAATEVIGGLHGGPALTADGKIAALAGTSGVSLLDTTNVQTVGVLPDKTARQMAFCAKGQLLLTLNSSQPSIVVWDVANKQSLTRWQLPEVCRAMAVDSQESFVLVVSQSGNAYTWPLPATPGELVALPALPAPKAAAADAKVHDVPDEGLVIRDTLTPQDPITILAPNVKSPARVFSVRLQGRQRYRLDLEGPGSMDPLLSIHKSDGTHMAFNDDVDGTLNSRILFIPPTDDIYRVSAGTLTGNGGEFVLRIAKAP